MSSRAKICLVFLAVAGLILLLSIPTGLIEWVRLAN